MSLNLVKTTKGYVRGIDQGSYAEFRGIPYAQPPIGNLRFAPPVECEPWNGTLSCTEFMPAPMQPMFHGGQYEIGEDCLYLNVFTPAQGCDCTNDKDKMPVFFWIYGGAFTFGASQEPTYDGAALCAKGCVLVTINYRINLFGFFNTRELEKRNGGARCCGILDQIAALKWVRENISAFGGDPDNVTIFGQSAGGMSTRMLLTSPLTEGLFAKSITHSGGGLNEGDLVRTKDEFTDMCERTLEHVGWTLDDLMNAPAKDAMETMMQGVRDTMADGDLQYFQPFLDGYCLTEVPGVAIYNGNYHKVPIMCGTVDGDSWMFSRKVRGQLEGEAEYFKGFAMCPSICWGRRNIEDGNPGIYSYHFSRKQPPKEHKYYTHGLPPFGADTPHACELPYLFGTLDRTGLKFQPYDYELAEIVRNYWVNFAKTGDPNNGGQNAGQDASQNAGQDVSQNAGQDASQNAGQQGLPCYWPKFEKGSEVSLYFGNDETIVKNLVDNDKLERVMKFQSAHPGMLCSLEGF